MRERKAEYKPLSFSTTMRNPSRMVDFLVCILPYDGKILTNDVIDEIVKLLVKRKIYKPVYIFKNPHLKQVLNEERDFSDKEVMDIILNSTQNHKEKGFDKGWPSRFDTWYKLSKEFGFVYYEMNLPIQISLTGHMLIDAYSENPINDEKIKNVFLNALVKYRTNNPFRKNLCDNSPLLLLLQVIKLLKDDPEENGAGVFRKEISLLICWPNNNAIDLYKKIKELRKNYRFNYGDEVVYELCINLLGATEQQQNRFKISHITGEAVDEYIRKMRITGVVSLRGNGRFLDFNSFESEKINYILEKYQLYDSFQSKEEYFKYIGTIDTNIMAIAKTVDVQSAENIKIKTLDDWVNKYSKNEILNELKITCRNGKSKNEVLKIIDKPTRFEFLISISLKQHFDKLTVIPNYHVDDEGLPTFTASGGIADIECFNVEYNTLVEVTLMSARNQATNEMPAITRHLKEAIERQPEIITFSILVAPSIHEDTKYMAGFSKYQYNIDILTYSIEEFIQRMTTKNDLIEFLKIK